MSVLIKGMKMPQSCYMCDMLELSGVVGCKHAYAPSNSEWGRALNCPLIELPDHGDLLDRDEAADDACLIWGRNSSGDDAAQEIIEHLRKMKAVIPAERSDASLCDNCDQRNDKGCCVCKYIKERSEE